MHFQRRVALLLGLGAACALLDGCGGKSSSPTTPTGPSGPYSTIANYMGIPGQAGLGGEAQAPTSMLMYLPQDLTFGPDNLPYILDWNNHRVRRVDADGMARTVIGTGQLGDAPDGTLLGVSLNHPTHVAFDPQGRLILSAWHNSKIMRADLNANWIESICGDGRRAYTGDGGLADTSAFDLPAATLVDASGNMFIMDQANQIVRRVDAATGIVSRFAGIAKSAGYSGDGGAATSAQIFQPVGQAAAPAGRIEFDGLGNMYIADYGNHRIRKIDVNGIITTVAGNGSPGFSGDGGPATSAQLNQPTDIAFGPDGSLFIADKQNSAIRKVDLSGTITTFAGRGGQTGPSNTTATGASIGDGGAPTSAYLFYPFGIAFDAAGNFYIADTYRHVIRIIRK
jgi:sugar lactone lactonase YvrE